MKQYTIYCTPDQTRKALVLGAPIEMFGSEDTSSAMVNFAMQENQLPDLEELLNQEDHATVIGSYAYCIPTAEQMCGWLEEKHNMRFNIYRYGPKDNNDASIYFREDRRETFYRIKRSYKEALIAAIDEALDYLLSIKQKEKQ